MNFTTKKTLGLAGLAAGIVYFAQNYTISGWQHLKIERHSTAALPASAQGLTGVPGFDLNRPSVRPGSSPGMPVSSHSTFASAIGSNPVSPSLTPPAVPKAIPTAVPMTIQSGSTASPIGAKTLLTEPAPVRIASFNLHLFGRHKAENTFVIETVAKVLRQYDVVALQEICTRQQDLLPILVDKINQGDRQFDYVIGPRVGRAENKEQFAFVFDTVRLETDRNQLYTVDDPEDLLNREPLVGWFRCKDVPSEAAFTFTLVNVHLDAEMSDAEIRVLPELVRSIQVDGRQEDDILLIGDFGASDRRIQFLQKSGMNFALEGVPTTVLGNAMLDNIVMPAKATDEFTGRSGVFDFLRRFNFSIDQAHQISDHLPAWAEFTSFEGGQPGRVE
jgi:endonuclease/exonuclease/phosphatase family metal-dependent hydrolase